MPEIPGFPTQEDIQREVEEAQRARKNDLEIGDSYAVGADIFKGDGAKRFNATSLRDWMAAAGQAGVPKIGATQVGSVTRDMLGALLDGEGDQDTLRRFREMCRETTRVFDRAGGQAVLRWDCCTSGGVKQAMAYDLEPGGRLGRFARGVAESRDPETGERILVPEVDDPRAVDMMGDYPQLEVPVFVRAWIEADRVPGEATEINGHPTYPREWRAFVRDGEVIGVSAYFPQAPLPESEDDRNLAMADDVRKRAERVADALRQAGARPHHPAFDRHRDEMSGSQLDFTLDFLEPADGGEPMLLEGGPPHMPSWGAHPCCFEVGNVGGVALGAGRVLPFPVASKEATP